MKRAGAALVRTITSLAMNLDNFYNFPNTTSISWLTGHSFIFTPQVKVIKIFSFVSHWTATNVRLLKMQIPQSRQDIVWINHVKIPAHTFGIFIFYSEVTYKQGAEVLKCFRLPLFMMRNRESLSKPYNYAMSLEREQGVPGTVRGVK